MSTNIAKIFLKLVDKHFPRIHRLHKTFNCNTIKVSYSYMINVQQLSQKHKKTLLKTRKTRQHIAVTVEVRMGIH